MSAKLKIISLEGQHSGLVLEAQFNPKEINITRAIPWQRQPKKGPDDLEYSTSEPLEMSCELLFDGFESGTSVQPQIDKLHHFSGVDATLHRPPKLKVIWGVEGAPGTMPKLDAVIEALSVKYTMFSPDGAVLRATVNIKFKEAGDLRVVKQGP